MPASDSAACPLERVYDVRLVRTPEIQERAAVVGGRGKLGDSVFRVLPASARKQNRTQLLGRRAPENIAGSDNTGSVRSVLSAVSERGVQVELRGWIRIDDSGSVFRVQEMVALAGIKNRKKHLP